MPSSSHDSKRKRDKKSRKKERRDSEMAAENNNDVSRNEEAKTSAGTFVAGNKQSIERRGLTRDLDDEYSVDEADVAISIDHDDIDEGEPLLLFEEHFVLTDSESDSTGSARSDAEDDTTTIDNFRLAKNAQTFAEEEFRNAFVELKPSKAESNTMGSVDKLAKPQLLSCEIKLTCGGFKVMAMSIVQGLLAGVELLQFLQFVFLESDLAFLHLTAAPVYLMRFLFFILYTIVCINVSESLIARSRERPDYQNPLQKTGPCTNFFLVIFNFGALLLTVANADFENFLFNSVMACDQEICFADGVGDFNAAVDSVAAPQCEAVVATCSSVVLNDVLQQHFYSFQAWKIGRLIRVVMAIMSFILWSLVKEKQTHDLEDHLQLMGGIIDSKVAAIDEATKKYSDLAGLNKLHMTLSELEELQSRQTGLLEQTTELLNLKRQQILS